MLTPACVARPPGPSERLGSRESGAPAHDTRPQTRDPPAPALPRLHHDRHRCARHRHRCEHRNLQRRQHPAAPAAPLRACRRARRALGAQHPPRSQEQRHLPRQLHSLARDAADVRRPGGGRHDVHRDADRCRRARRAANAVRDRLVLFAARREADDRPALHRRGGSPSEPRGRHQRSLVEAAIRQRSLDRRSRNHAAGNELHGRGCNARRLLVSRQDR